MNVFSYYLHAKPENIAEILLVKDLDTLKLLALGTMYKGILQAQGRKGKGQQVH